MTKISSQAVVQIGKVLTSLDNDNDEEEQRMAEPVLDNNNEVKQRAIKRLIVAVGLVFVAVGILTYLSYYKPAKVVTKPAPETLPPPPPPIVTGPEPSTIDPAPLDQAVPVPPPPAEAPPVEATAPPPPDKQAPLAPPPPPVVVSKPLPKPGPGPDKSVPPSTQQAAKPLVKAESAPAVPPLPAPAPAPNNFIVQFGVFANVQNALQLVERLKAAGIAAQTETRVQLAPFQSKAEAEAALAKMKEKGLNATLVSK